MENDLKLICDSIPCTYVADISTQAHNILLAISGDNVEFDINTGGGEQPTLFAPTISANGVTVNVTNPSSNGSFPVTVTGTVNGVATTFPYTMTMGNLYVINATSSAANFHDGVSTATYDLRIPTDVINNNFDYSEITTTGTYKYLGINAYISQTTARANSSNLAVNDTVFTGWPYSGNRYMCICKSTSSLTSFTFKWSFHAQYQGPYSYSFGNFIGFSSNTDLNMGAYVSTVYGSKYASPKFTGTLTATNINNPSEKYVFNLVQSNSIGSISWPSSASYGSGADFSMVLEGYLQ